MSDDVLILVEPEQVIISHMAIIICCGKEVCHLPIDHDSRISRSGPDDSVRVERVIDWRDLCTEAGDLV